MDLNENTKKKTHRKAKSGTKANKKSEKKAKKLGLTSEDMKDSHNPKVCNYYLMRLR